MLNKKVMLGVTFLFAIMVFSLGVFAEEVTDVDTSAVDAGVDLFEGLDEEYGDEQIVDAGLTPDSAFYFIDEFFDRFGDDLANREERISEIKVMIEAGDFDSARSALEKYKSYAKNLEADANPENEEESRRSAAAIQNALEEIKEDIPEDQREEFYEEVIETERGILTAVEISSKIKELCVQLAELDPVEYSRVCGVDDEGPGWKKRLHEDLTEEQRQEAKDFGNIMSQCFETSGRDCDCEEISFYDFSVACSKVAPLAIACDEGDENACKEMDEIEMPELPDYLEDIFEDIENKYGEGKYDMHMPPECVEAGATSPKECGLIMINEHAPVECRDALLEADVQSEREGREICDKIMFELHAPMECMDEGITDPSECARFMESFRHDGPRGPEGFGAPGQDCMKLEDPTERLKCFEGAVGNMGEHYGIGDRFEEQQGELTWQCKENRIHWAPDCEKFMREEWPQQERMREEERGMRMEEENEWSREKEQACANSCESQGKPWDFFGGRCSCGEPGQYSDNQGGFYQGEDNYQNEDNYEESECKDGCSQECPGASRTDCVDGGRKCECYYEDEEPQYAPEEGPGEPTNEPISEPTVEPTPEPTVDSTPEPTPDSIVTGEVIGNRFLNYYSR